MISIGTKLPPIDGDTQIVTVEASATSWRDLDRPHVLTPECWCKPVRFLFCDSTFWVHNDARQAPDQISIIPTH